MQLKTRIKHYNQSSELATLTTDLKEKERLIHDVAMMCFPNSGYGETEQVSSSHLEEVVGFLQDQDVMLRFTKMADRLTGVGKDGDRG